MCPAITKHVLGPLIFLSLFSSGCTPRQNDESKANPSSNAAILDEVNEAQAWFHAKKARPIWAKRLEHDQTVTTIEGTEQVKAGTYLCRGEAGDIWPQTAQSLGKKYQKTKEVDREGWCKYIPRPDNQGVMAAQVQHGFRVHARWGVLSAKPGDYIVKNFIDRDVAYPDDVWIVDQKLFQATYQAVAKKP